MSQYVGLVGVNSLTFSMEIFDYMGRVRMLLGSVILNVYKTKLPLHGLKNKLL